MPMPPYTPSQLLEGLAERPSLRRRIGLGWVIVGSLVVAFIVAMAVAHYGYGMPVHDQDTGAPSTPANTLTMFLLIGGSGAFFAVMGTLLLRWKPR
jgi:TRAP-type C4-dicarboxylate transport system permease small subunit